MSGGRLIHRRNAHETLDRQSVLFAAGFDEAIGLLRQNPRLLRLRPGIDLHIKARRFSAAVDFRRQRDGKLFPVQRLDHIEQRHGLFHLVGLERPNEVQLEIRIRGTQRGPLALGLLHAVLAEDALSRLDHRPDLRLTLGFGDGHKLHFSRLAPAILCSARNTLANLVISVAHLAQLPPLSQTILSLTAETE